MLPTPATGIRSRPEPAVVVLHDRRSYLGLTVITNGVVHCQDAARRVHHHGGVSYRPIGARTWPLHLVREIRWIADERSDGVAA